MSTLALCGGPKVRTTPYVTHAVIGEEERRRVAEVLDSGMLSGFIGRAGASFLGGNQVREFEQLVKEYFRCAHVVASNSATSNLHMAVAACGIGPGDEVIVTPYTMSATATAIVMQNAVPVFVDIDAMTGALDPHKIAAAITPRTKAILVVHLFGYPADMDPIMAIARARNLYVIEDCAQAPGAHYKGQLVGTIGDIGIFSLNQHKTITSGEGGFAITNDAQLAFKMQLIRNHGEVVINDMPHEDIINVVGYNYRMTELEAAVSIGQFRRLDERNAHRQALAVYLADRLKSIPEIILPQPEPERSHVYFVFPMRWREEVAGFSRDLFVKALVAEGIPAGAGYVRPIYWEPMYQQRVAHGKSGCPFACPLYQGKTDYARGLCPVVERLHLKELFLTAICRHPHTKADIDDMVEAVQKILENRRELKNMQAQS